MAKTLTTTGMTAAGGNNSGVTLTVTAVSGLRPVIRHIAWSYSSAPAGGLLVSVGTGTVFNLDIVSAGPGEIRREIRGDSGGGATVTLNAGGAGVSGVVNADWLYLL